MTTYPKNLIFQDVPPGPLRMWFAEVLAAYPELADRTIYLRQAAIARSTMQAQPVINWRFFRRATRAYRIEFSNHLAVTDHVRVQDLPKAVVVGWFAHELGHVLDFLDRPSLGMISFGLRYALWSPYLRKAERRADTFAIRHGFGREIMATKQYLFDHATLPQRYKKRLRKYYLSADEIEGILFDWEEKRQVHTQIAEV